MEKNKRGETPSGLSLPEPNSKELMGKQSVRATFKLSEECVAAIQIVSTHLRIKQKSLFDHLIEDTESLRFIGKELSGREFNHGQRIQKTFVLSRRTISSLEKISTDFNVSRNALIEYSVRRLLPIIAEERKKHAQHKKLLSKIENHFGEGLELLKLVKKSVGSDDPIFQKFESVLSGYSQMVQEVKDIIEKGNPIEGFPEDAFSRMRF